MRASQRLMRQETPPDKWDAFDILLLEGGLRGDRRESSLTKASLIRTYNPAPVSALLRPFFPSPDPTRSRGGKVIKPARRTRTLDCWLP